MMLEETIIRESATNKLQQRSTAPPKVKVIGPPVTFANPKPEKQSSEESKDASLAAEGLNDANFDVVQSPVQRSTSQYVSGKDKSAKGAPQQAMVP